MTTQARAVPVPLIAKTDATNDPPPIACTLGAGEVDARLQEWRAVLAHVTARVAVDGGVRLALDATAPLTEIVRLATAEHDCCRFFAFAITVDARGVALEVRAPDGAADLVDAVFGSGS
jgi:hypothetical protein